jgi:hypothetical protein
MSLAGVVLGVTGNFDRQILSGAVRKAGGRVDALVHKNLDYVRCCCRKGACGERERPWNMMPRAPCACSCAQSWQSCQTLTCRIPRQLISDDEAVKRNTQRVRKVAAVDPAMNAEEHARAPARFCMLRASLVLCTAQER